MQTLKRQLADGISQSMQSNAVKLVAGGHVKITQNDEHIVRAVVFSPGSGLTYKTQIGSDGYGTCECKRYKDTGLICKHVVALLTTGHADDFVIDRPERQINQPDDPFEGLV